MVLNKRRIFLENYKKNKSCAMCGWNEHTEILAFHHKDPKEKDNEISKMNSISKLNEEMKKCTLLCPNCHFWYHYQADNRKQEYRVRDGECITRSPFGYKLENKKLIQTEHFYVVQEIFQDFLNKKISLTQLSKKFDFSVNGLKKILTNQTYIGKLKYRGKIYEGKHKPIINASLFNKVQDKLKKRLNYYKQIKKKGGAKSPL